MRKIRSLRFREDNDSEDDEKKTSTPKEGGPCTVDGREGTLVSKDGNLVCVLHTTESDTADKSEDGEYYVYSKEGDQFVAGPFSDAASASYSLHKSVTYIDDDLCVVHKSGGTLRVINPDGSESDKRLRDEPETSDKMKGESMYYVVESSSMKAISKGFKSLKKAIEAAELSTKDTMVVQYDGRVARLVDSQGKGVHVLTEAKFGSQRYNLFKEEEMIFCVVRRDDGSMVAGPFADEESAKSALQSQDPLTDFKIQQIIPAEVSDNDTGADYGPGDTPEQDSNVTGPETSDKINQAATGDTPVTERSRSGLPGWI
jgi:hypothetical protein